jgi:hypothetical protein
LRKLIIGISPLKQPIQKKLIIGIGPLKQQIPKISSIIGISQIKWADTNNRFFGIDRLSGPI